MLSYGCIRIDGFARPWKSLLSNMPETPEDATETTPYNQLKLITTEAHLMSLIIGKRFAIYPRAIP